MKKFFIILLAALGLFSLTCCASLPTPITETYLVESGVITDQTYSTARLKIMHWIAIDYQEAALVETIYATIQYQIIQHKKL